MHSDISTPEMLVKESRDQPASPFVEIAEHNPRPRNLAVAKDGFADQFARLASPLDKRSAEMHVVDMQPALFSQSDIDAQASALFAPGYTDVVILRPEQRKAAQREVAVNSSPQLAVMPHTIVETQSARYKMSLIIFTGTPMNAEDFLQRHDVGVNLFQHTYDPRGVESPINPDAFVYVVSDDSKFADLTHSGLFHSEWISNSALPSCLRGAAEKP